MIEIINCSRQHSRRTCPRTILLSIFIVLFFTLSHFHLSKTTFYLNDNNITLSPSLQCLNTNETRIKHGQKHLAESRVIICGLIRDREHHIKRLKQQLNEITKLFADYAVLILENDSKDGTRRELIHWANANQRIHIIGSDNNLSIARTQKKYLPETSNIEKMVRLRNNYLNYIENNSLLNKFDYIIVEDFDLTTYTYINGLFSTGFYLNNDLTIDAICSNGILSNKLLGNRIIYETYFDPYAHKDKQNENWSKIYNDLWSTLFRKYSCNDNLIHVKSCFSGRTIYRYKSIVGKRYRTYLDQNQQTICEHVGLHETFNKMYLNSEMIFYITKNNI